MVVGRLTTVGIGSGISMNTEYVELVSKQVLHCKQLLVCPRKYSRMMELLFLFAFSQCKPAAGGSLSLKPLSFKFRSLFVSSCTRFKKKLRNSWASCSLFSPHRAFTFPASFCQIISLNFLLTPALIQLTLIFLHSMVG